MTVTQNLYNSYEESRRIISEAIKNDRLVLFVGAGVSANSGMPLWGDALDKIKRALGRDLDDETNNLKIPQLYYDERGKNEYTTLMRKIFRYGEPLSTSSIHRQLMQFNVSTIITTNYDNLLEQAAEENFEVMQVVSCDKDLAYLTSGKTLIKMHGDFEHDNFVLKEDDYKHYDSNFRLISNYIRSLFGTKIILFVGYSFNDPDIQNLLSWVKNILKDDLRPAYLIDVGNEYDASLESKYKRLGVNVIFAKTWLDNTKDLSPGDVLSKALYKFSENSYDLSPAEDVYQELKKFEGWNHVFYNRYLKEVFAKYYIEVDENNYLTSANLDDAPIKRIFKSNKKDDIIAILSHSTIQGYKIKKEQCDFENRPQPEWVEKAFKFDFEGLTKIKNNTFLDDNHPELYLQQAAISYILGEYVNSYNYLKQATRALYRTGNYYYYFISEIDKKHLGNYIIKHKDLLKLEPEVISHIHNEISTINVDKILKSLRELGKSNIALNDIANFNFFNSFLQNVYTKIEELNKEANTNYSLYAGSPAYLRLRKDMRDFSNYELENYILLDKTYQIQEIYEMYIRGILSSTTAIDKNRKNVPGLLGLVTSFNIHSKGLNGLDLFIILHQMKDLNQFFTNSTLDILQVNNKGLKDLYQIAKNLTKTVSEEGKRIYWNLITLCGYIKLDNQIASLLLKDLTSKLTFENLRNYGDIISSFLINASNQDLFNNTNGEDLKKLLSQSLEIISDHSEFQNANIIRGISYSLNLLKVSFAQLNSIEELINKNVTDPLTFIYSECNNTIKTKIREYYSQKYSQQKYDQWTNKVIETHAVDLLNAARNDIIPSSNLENKFIMYLKEKNTKIEKIHFSPNPVQIILYGLADLYIYDKATNTQEIEDVINKYGDNRVKWIINPKKFDYNHFEIEWIEDLSISFLHKLSTDKHVKAKLREKFAEAFKEHKLDNILLKRYFEYIAN